MGNYYTSIVPIEVDDSALDHLELRILSWLQDDRIIKKELTGCILGKELGFAPDVHYYKAIHDDFKDNDILSLGVNGLEVITNRTVFSTNELDGLNCPNCGHDILAANWSDSISNWHDGGEGLFTCDQCLKTQSITEMIFSPPWAFSSIGFTFWNWGVLKDSFMKDFERIADHECVVISGKL